MLLGPVLVLSAEAAPSWTFTASPSSSGAAGFEVAFFPGDHLIESCSGTCSSGGSLAVPYDSWGLNQTAGLYESYQAVWAVAGILGVLSVFLAILALRRIPSRPLSGRPPRVLALLTVGFVLVALLVLVGAQPATLSAAAGAPGNARWPNEAPSPADSFLGSCVSASSTPSGACAAGESDSWGPGLGFYLALLGASFSLLGAGLFGAARRSLRTPPREPYRPLSPTGGTEGTRPRESLPAVPLPLQPPPENVPTSSPPAPHQEKCPRCGWYTPWPAAYCRACGAPLLRG